MSQTLLNTWILNKSSAIKLLADLSEVVNSREAVENEWHGRGFEKVSYELPRRGNQLVICMEGQSMHVKNILGEYHVKHYANESVTV